MQRRPQTSTSHIGKQIIDHASLALVSQLIIREASCAVLVSESELLAYRLNALLSLEPWSSVLGLKTIPEMYWPQCGHVYTKSEHARQSTT